MRFYFGGGVSKIIERLFVPYAIWFLIGVYCYIFRDTIIPKIKKWWVLLLIVYTVVMVMKPELPGYYTNIFISLTCPFIVIGASYALPSIRIKVDITYGIFLYHWIILNIIVHLRLFERLSVVMCELIFITMTIIVATLSRMIIGNLRRFNRRG